jgi:hypothetical protein
LVEAVEVDLVPAVEAVVDTLLMLQVSLLLVLIVLL